MLKMMMMMGTMMSLMLPMIIVEMKRVPRVLVTMMKFRTGRHKESSNVFSSVKTFVSKY